MPEEVQISGTNAVGKIRNPLGVIGLTLITFGIYWIFWYYYTQKELAEMGRVRNTEELGTAPGTSVLAVTLGAFIIVPPFVSIYNAAKRLDAARRLTGQEGMEPGLLFLLWIFISPIGLYIYQSDMNKVLQTQAGGAPATAQVPPPAEQSAQPPQQQPAPPPPPPPGS
jgi:drug/metabolite transporter (DMT)-like permease